MERKKRNVKIIFPSTITTFSMTFGFIAILLATNGKIINASYMIMISMLMDGLDGKVARYTNTASEFGIQYDSLSDLVAFGVAPCVVYSRFYLHEQVSDSVFYLLPIMFMVCGAIRLARFNVTASIYGKKHFTGLPIPAAAFMVVSTPLFYQWAGTLDYFRDWYPGLFLSKELLFRLSIVLIIALSLSMISTMRFDTPGTFWLGKFKYRPANYLVMAAFLALNLIDFSVFAMGISVYYLLSMYGRALYYRIHKSEELTFLEENEARG